MQIMSKKLIIQIPCFNEAETLPQVLRDLPREVPGIDRVEYLVIDDGSTDATVETARRLGVHHIVRLPRNQGLAKAFSAGLDHALKRGATVIVNTDGDNQYRGDCIPDLVAPVLSGKADIVIGARPIETIQDFSWLKKRLQRFGSRVVSAMAGVHVDDTTSGFRAFSREAAHRLILLTRFSYTLDTIFQAAAKNLAVASVPIRTNPKTRPSRLFRNIPHYIYRSTRTILSVFAVYKPILFFSLLGMVISLPGLYLGIRFLYYYLHGKGAGHVQSLILASILLSMGFQVFLTGLHSHITATNRKISEEVLFRLKKTENDLAAKEYSSISPEKKE